MPAYHSTLNELQAQEACGCAILPIKTRARGPAPPAPEDQPDIVDEILTLFRANVLFTNFEIKGNADRVLIYGTLFVHLCLKKLDRCSSKADATRILQQTAVDSFAIPGDSSFPLGGLVRAPSSANEAETIRAFFKQLREAIAFRLVDEVFPNGEKSKWWMLFAKRKFMNKELSR
ncbi:Actin-related protein 2/3 complex subunit 3 [Phytophthora cinnamomi]|uniref:Actin-related protein 2/3 complex subunit 3 n=1 Tax=Phytophthora cinnamomi TaxID=4785 RepID=UPI0035598305|nr:Actin-related protein 2/3 complex subunit 3 [Phytophthora cinnamomi]